MMDHNRESIDKNTEGLIRLEGKLEGLTKNVEDLKDSFKDKQDKNDKILSVLGSIEFRQETLHTALETITKHTDSTNHKNIVLNDVRSLLSDPTASTSIVSLVVNSDTYQKKRKEEAKEHWESVEGIISKRILRWFILSITTPIVLYVATRIFIGS